jgi:hypothetical protein
MRVIVFCIVLFIASLDAMAKPRRVDGACGSANGTPTSVAPTTNLCAVGTASAMIGTGPWAWSCAGSRGGSTAQCSAPYSPPPPPTLTLTFSPPDPSLPDSSPNGTVVSIVTAAWSDGSRFTGTLGFDAPYYDDGGTFALSGNQVIVSPTGLGLLGDVGTIQRVTIVATQ